MGGKTRNETKTKLFLKIQQDCKCHILSYNEFCINVMKLFVKTDDKLILFNSFGGRKYDDSPKAVFDVMKKS